MKQKIFTLMLCVLISLSFTLLPGCERMSEMIGPPDTTMTTLKVGVLQPSEYYVNFVKGAELARDEINQNGGILGMQIEFIFKNIPGVDPSVSESPVQIATKLIEKENVVALLDPSFSTDYVPTPRGIKHPIFTTLPALNNTKYYFLPEYNGPLFLVASSSTLPAEILAQFVKKELLANNTAVIYQVKDADAINFTEEFQANFQNLGGTTRTVVYKSGDTNFDTQLSEVPYQVREPNVVLLPSFDPKILLLIEQALGFWIDCPSCSGDGSYYCPTVCYNLPPPLFLANVSWDEINKVIAPLEGYHYIADLYKSINDIDTTQLIKNYKKMFGSPPDNIAESGYYAVKHLAMAVGTAQSVETFAVRNALANIESVAQIMMFQWYDF
ncbi:MAG: ABC transporter substrate-binding protein [Candidatus Poribacteria bacterium]|nr:ABC transporter substrate-binding protein [Candidatus Poribacteria bacterium]